MPHCHRHNCAPDGGSAEALPPPSGTIKAMDIDRHPFVLAALDDLSENRVRTVTAQGLAPEAVTPRVATRASTGHSANDEHRVTETFHSLWTSLSQAVGPNRNSILSVMRGVAKDRQHPAYRVSATDLPNVYQAKVGPDVLLAFHASPQPTGDGSYRDELTWLAVLHA